MSIIIFVVILFLPAILSIFRYDSWVSKLTVVSLNTVLVIGMFASALFHTEGIMNSAVVVSIWVSWLLLADADSKLE